MKTKRP